MRKSRSISHPDWLKQAMDDFKKTTALHERGILPKSIEFFMVSTPIHRMMRCCFPEMDFGELVMAQPTEGEDES